MSDLIAAYEAALNGRKGEVAQALEACDEHLVRLPNDREAQLYRGALLVLSGRDATLPWTRARLVREGLALMDEALDRSRAAGAPPSLRLLVVRALSNARLPRLLRAPRHALTLLEEISGHAQYAGLPEAIRVETAALIRELAAHGGVRPEACAASRAEGERDARPM